MINIKTKKVIKEVFDNKFNKDTLKDEIVIKSNKDAYQVFFKILVPISIIVLFVSIFVNGNSNQTNGGLDYNKETSSEALDEVNSFSTRTNENHADIVLLKVYAYNDSLNTKKEILENVQILLDSYSKASSVAPGYDIYFELNNLDYINVSILDGEIILWERPDGKVTTLKEKNYQLNKSKELFFDITDKTIINIKGYQNDELKIEKEIIFKTDENYNYYAILKNKMEE